VDEAPGLPSPCFFKIVLVLVLVLVLPLLPPATLKARERLSYKGK
jgi:hypothetical protein